jgi:hypothetical protein
MAGFVILAPKEKAPPGWLQDASELFAAGAKIFSMFFEPRHS